MLEEAAERTVCFLEAYERELESRSPTFNPRLRRPRAPQKGVERCWHDLAALGLEFVP